MRGTTGGDDAVDVLGTDGALVGAEEQPRDGAGVFGAGVGAGRGVDLVDLGGEHVDVTNLELRDAVDVEEVVTRKGEGVQAVELEGRRRREGVLGVGAAGDVRGGGHVEGHIEVPEGVGGEIVEVVEGEGRVALAGVEIGDVVEDGECASGLGLGACFGASVVLYAKAEGDGLESGVAGRTDELFLCGGCWSI